LSQILHPCQIKGVFYKEWEIEEEEKSKRRKCLLLHWWRKGEEGRIRRKDKDDETQKIHQSNEAWKSQESKGYQKYSGGKGN